jgi:hypothetical protein
MGKTVDAVTPELASFIEQQHVFFVATAPLAADGHVNLSPKGLDTFRLLSPTQAAYLDLTGSGNETAAHVAENERITIMFCSFAGGPMILRLYGRGRVVLPGTPEWAELAPRFPEFASARQIVVADVDRVQTSCGFGVPTMELVGERDMLQQWAAKKGPEGLAAYRRQKNATSIDGLPAPRAET